MRKYDWLTHTWTASSPESQSENTDSTRTGYSRGMNWDSSTDPVSWKVSGVLSTESSWPLSQTSKLTTIANMMIDEPNQQGLSNQNAASALSKIDKLIYNVIFLLLYINI